MWGRNDLGITPPSRVDVAGKMIWWGAISHIQLVRAYAFLPQPKAIAEYYHELFFSPFLLHLVKMATVTEKLQIKNDMEWRLQKKKYLQKGFTSLGKVITRFERHVFSHECQEEKPAKRLHTLKSQIVTGLIVLWVFAMSINLSSTCIFHSCVQTFLSNNWLPLRVVPGCKNVAKHFCAVVFRQYVTITFAN